MITDETNHPVCVLCVRPRGHFSEKSYLPSTRVYTPDGRAPRRIIIVSQLRMFAQSVSLWRPSVILCGFFSSLLPLVPAIFEIKTKKQINPKCFDSYFFRRNGTTTGVNRWRQVGRHFRRAPVILKEHFFLKFYYIYSADVYAIIYLFFGVF